MFKTSNTNKDSSLQEIFSF